MVADLDPLPSLRARLLRHVLLPLALTWLGGSALAVALANYFVSQAFDRTLLDDAHALAANVHQSERGWVMGLSPVEVKTVLFDQVERVYFAVLDQDGRLIAGHPGLRHGEVPAKQGHAFSDQAYDSYWLRSATLRLPAGFTVVVAETTRGRQVLLQRLAVFSMVPQLLLLVMLGAWLRRAVRAELSPLTMLERAVDERDAHDLKPLRVPARTHELAHLMRAINALLARLGHSIEAQRQFAGNIAHQLRTPLAGIRAQAEYGLAQTDPPAWRTQLQGIAGSEARASHLIDQLLALALADEAQVDMRRQPVPLEPLIQQAVLRLLPRADAAGVDLGAQGLEGQEGQTVLQAHPALLEGILDNLLDNALRYGRPESGATPRVTVVLSRQGGQVVLSVQDNGPGLAPHERQSLMQRWSQGSLGERLGQGMGLGLAIAAQYARILGAQLSLEPGDGQQGLAATVRFAAAAGDGPLADATAGGRPAAA